MLRHNEVRDITADLLTEVWWSLLLSGESFTHHSAITEDNAHVDVVVTGFWPLMFKFTIPSLALMLNRL